MVSKLQTCRDCKHFELRIASGEMGMCHRYPPQVTGSFVGGPDPKNPSQVVGKIVNDTFWPMVPSSAWCGEFALALLKVN